MLKLIFVWLLAALFLSNALLITIRTNFNTGTLMMWIVSALLIVYGIFNKRIDAFEPTGIIKWLKILLIAGCIVFACLFVFVAMSGYTNSAQGDERAIIILGAGLQGEKPGEMLHRRLQAGFDAWQENPDALLVVTGGQGPQETISEGLAMQRWLLQRGVPAENILLENKSTSTEENLLFAKALLAEKGVDATQPVAIATTAFHCYRAGQYAARAGFTDVRFVPASINITVVLPSYMREVLALLYLWVFRK